jgi:hypothetical protein
MDKHLEEIFEKHTINNVLTITDDMLDEIIEYEYSTNQLESVFYTCPKNSGKYKALCDIRKYGLVLGFRKVI